MNGQELTIRPARVCDIPRILELLRQVNNVHHALRPELFIKNKTKYEAEELALLIGKEDAAIFVAEDAQSDVRGYLFAFVRARSGPNLTGGTSLYIDDLCVDEGCRGTGVGRKLLDHAKAYAGQLGCREVLLTVWEGNESAQRFYRNNGFTPRSCLLELGLTEDAGTL